MTQEYDSPPVKEVVCQIEFEPSESWDNTIVGMFYDKIKDSFPKKNVKHEVGFNVDSDKVNQLISVRNQFFTENKDSAIQLGKNVLAINKIDGYKSWESFKPKIIEAIKKYKSVTNPKNINRIRLDYLNKVELNEDSEVKDYFNFYPQIEQSFLDKATNFSIDVEMDIGDGSILNLELFSNDNAGENLMTFIFDLEYYSEQNLEFDKVNDWLDKAHNKIEEIFEKSITDKCRESFK